MLPADRAPGVLVVGGEDFVAGPEPKARGHGVHAFGGIARQDYFAAFRAQEFRCFAPHLFHTSAQSIVRRTGFLLQHAGRDRVYDQARCGSHAAAVQVDHLRVYHELLADLAPQGPGVGSGMYVRAQSLQALGQGSPRCGKELDARQSGRQAFYKGSSFHLDLFSGCWCRG